MGWACLRSKVPGCCVFAEKRRTLLACGVELTLVKLGDRPLQIGEGMASRLEKAAVQMIRFWPVSLESVFDRKRHCRPVAVESSPAQVLALSYAGGDSSRPPFPMRPPLGLFTAATGVVVATGGALVARRLFAAVVEGAGSRLE